jgi:hypothetical protein
MRSDGADLLALDEHVGLGEIAHGRVQRHHGPTPDDVAALMPAGILRLIAIPGPGRPGREQVGAGRRDSGGGRRPEKIPPRCRMVLRNSVIASRAHGCLLRGESAQ